MNDTRTSPVSVEQNVNVNDVYFSENVNVNMLFLNTCARERERIKFFSEHSEHWL